MKRTIIGIVVPSRNTTIETEFHLAAPEQVFGISARAETNYPLEWKTDDKMAEMAAAIQAGEPPALKRLAPAEPEAVIIGETSTFTSHQDYQDRSHVYRDLAGCPVFFWVDAFLEAFRKLGIEKSVAVAGPKKRASGKHVSGPIFEEIGISTCAVEGFGCNSAAEIAAISPSDIDRVVAQLDSPSAEAICLFGTNIAALKHVENVERKIGKPLLHINTVLIWYVLRQLGIKDQRPGYGRLFSDC